MKNRTTLTLDWRHLIAGAILATALFPRVAGAQELIPAAYTPAPLGINLVTLAATLNIGTNRWAFKPELGLVQVIGRWAFDVYVGGWLFTTNTDFYGGKTREQDPILSTQAHVRYAFSRRVWAAFDMNYWRGGQTTVDGTDNNDLQSNSRVGSTVSTRFGTHHTLRLAASKGAITRIGGDFNSFGLSYGYSWAQAR